MGATGTEGRGRERTRIAVYYAAVAAVTAAAVALAFSLGASRHAEPNVGGIWAITPPDPCLGSGFVLQQSGSFGTIKLLGTGGSTSAVRINRGVITGTISCAGRSERIRGRTAGKPPKLSLDLNGRRVLATNTEQPLPPAGTSPVTPTSLAGAYAVVPPGVCLGASVTLANHGSGHYLLTSGSRKVGVISFDSGSGAVSGTATCPLSGAITIAGVAMNRTVTLVLKKPSGQLVDHVQLQRTRETEDLFAAFFLAVAVVMLLAQLGGRVMIRLGQPRVMGEVLVGILLGPTLLGALAPHVEAALFPVDVIPYIGVAANFGLVFYMFLIGLELDLGSLKGRVLQTMTISNTGVALPMALGTLVAVPLYRLLGTQKSFPAFALFMGVSMSITAFPVLARILVERRMLHSPLGSLAISSAALDDITAWMLVALASAAAGTAANLSVGATILLTVLFVLVMATLVRPLLARVAVAFGETGSVPVGWIVAIFAGVLLSAYITETIGVAIIFGGFIIGTIMPRDAGLTEDVTRRLDSFVATVLLPLFFASTGLNTNVLLLNRSDLILITLLLIGVAIVAKFGATLLAGRVTGLGWRDASVLGSLMNTRGLTELIVLNLALQFGVISIALFAALVVMALVTTFMTGPLVNALDPRRRLQADPGDALEAALAQPAPAPPPQQKILVAPDSRAGLDRLLAIAEPLARSQPPRELVIVRLLKPTAGTEIRGGLQTERRALRDASAELSLLREALAARGVSARGAALTSTDPGSDIAKLADREGVDLVLLDGRRPLVGSAIPGGDIRAILDRAEPDVVVLVAQEQHRLPPLLGAPIVVPFGGASHDWAAVELGAWLSSAFDAPLLLVGAARSADPAPDEGDASRLLANASLMLQRFYGVDSEPVITERGAAGVLAAAQGAGLIVVGLSDRWREEGLGETRAQLARSAPAPILFVRRGSRRGALAGRDDVTRFTWSGAGSSGTILNAPPAAE